MITVMYGLINQHTKKEQFSKLANLKKCTPFEQIIPFEKQWIYMLSIVRKHFLTFLGKQERQ